MMQAGNEGGEDRKDDQIYPETDKLALRVCDASNNDFKKTWLTLKELHDKELHHLQAEITSLRKERLVNRRGTSSIAKIKELKEQQKVFNDTLQALQRQLESETCERCTVNETYRSKLEQEFNAMQQENRKVIAELTAERDKLRKENKMLSEKLKLSQQIFSPFSSSDDDFIPCSQGAALAFMIKYSKEGNDVHQPMKFLEQLLGPAQLKSEEKKEEQQTPQLPPTFHSPDLLDMADTSYESLDSDITRKLFTKYSDYQKSPVFPSVSTYSFQRGHGFKTASNLSEDKLGQAKEKQMSRDNTSIQKTSPPVHFLWNISSIAEEENQETLVPETPEEDMPQKPTKSSPSTPRRKRSSTNVFALDYTKRKIAIRIPRCDIGGSEGGINCQIASSEQATQQKNTNESTGVAKPQGGNQSSTLGSKIKPRMQSE